MIEHTRAEVERAKAATSMTEMEALVAQAEPPRNFFIAATGHRDAVHFSVIPEIARRTPRLGDLRPEFAADGFTPETIAAAFERHGAAAISCCTNERYHGGHLSHIERIKSAVSLPVLRKDIIIDPWQLWESRAAGADAVVLIAEALNEAEIVDMLILSQQLQMTSLLQVRELDQLLRVSPYIGFPHEGYCLLGISNVDPATGEADLSHTLRLADMVERRSILVSDGGVSSREDLLRLRSVGVRIAIEREGLLSQEDPGPALAKLVRSPFSRPRD